MTLKETLQNDMKTAMKAGPGAATKLGTIRGLISEVKRREIDNKHTALDDAQILKVISTLIKQRQDSIDQFTKGGRPDLADKEKEELAVLQAYMPAQLGAAEVEAMVVAAIAETGATSPADIGKVMKAAMAKADGKADGKLINELARKKLSPQKA